MLNRGRNRKRWGRRQGEKAVRKTACNQPLEIFEMLLPLLWKEEFGLRVMWHVFLVCNHVARRPCWGQYNRNVFSNNLHENRGYFPEKRNAFCSWRPRWPLWRHLQTRSIRVHFSLYLKTKAFVWSHAFIKMTCVRQQNTVNVYLLTIKFNLHHVLALIIPQ